jgi:endonuclease YncB( thermonuclease family)
VLFTGLRKALITSAFLFCAFFVSTILAATEIAEVRHVIDGDTLVLADGKHVRLIGINAPEIGHACQTGPATRSTAPSSHFGKDCTPSPDQPLARDARAQLTNLVRRQQVTLSFEHERHDRYGRLLAHVLLADGQSVDEILLRQGLAWMIAIPPNIEQLSRLQAAEQEARAGQAGIWNEPAYKPVPAERLAPKSTGFYLIEGTVRAWRLRHQVIYFDLAPGVTLVVPNEDWKKYYTGKPGDLAGRRVVARGWLTEYKGGLHMRVPHPAMLTLLN